MSRTNAVLLGGVVVLAVVYFFVLRDRRDATTPPPPRLFPEFNKEAADRIELSEGWIGTRYEMRKVGSNWVLASAGDFPVKAETANKLVAAVYHLRAENPVTSDPAHHKSMRVDAQGRRVRVYRGETVMADFRVGGSPKGGWKETFIRKEDSPVVYRTSTVIDPGKKGRDGGHPWDLGDAPFSWDTYVQKVGIEWLDTEIFSMGDGEVQQLELVRQDGKVRIVREGQDQWKLVEPEEAPADTDAVLSLTGGLRFFSMADVLGKTSDVAARYGLDAPQGAITFVVKKKISRKEEEKKPEEPKEGEALKESDAPKEEYTTVRYTVKVGTGFKRGERIEDDGKIVEGDYYPMTISADPPDEKLAKKVEYVFAVSKYSVQFLEKKLEQLKQKPKEEATKKEGGEEEGHGKGEAAEGAGNGAKAPESEEPKQPEESEKPKGGETPEGPRQPEEPKEPEESDPPSGG